MLNKEEIERRYSIISEFCKKYRKELTEYGGKITNEFGFSDSQSYIDFMNEKSEDVFVGNYLVNLFNDTAIQEYEDVLNGKRSLKDLFDEKWKSLLCLKN